MRVGGFFVDEMDFLGDIYEVYGYTILWSDLQKEGMKILSKYPPFRQSDLLRITKIRNPKYRQPVKAPINS